MQQSTLQLMQQFVERSKVPKLRTMRDFAEQEIVLPDGPYSGRRYRCDRQPYSSHWFEAIDSGRWSRFFGTGPTQSGKTISFFVIPMLYHLFEIGETVICGLPTQEMAIDKWEMDIRPLIESSRYRDYLPRKGAGSQGGTPTLITFGNGARLRFMTGGGSDKKRAGFTSRVLVMTEIDGFDQAGQASREADKITQLEGRTRAYGDRKRIYGECTVSIEKGRIWQEYMGGTSARIVLCCPYCGKWETPEREHLRGYQDCQSDRLAKQSSHFVCPACSHPWNEADRRVANEKSRVVLAGQAVTPQGKISGTAMEKETFSFRYSAVNNLLIKTGNYGMDEWRAIHADDEENAEKELRQFVWALPYQPPIEDEIELRWEQITARTTDLERGVYPEELDFITVGIDVGSRFGWFCVIAWSGEAEQEQQRGAIIDYGSFENPSGQYGIDHGIQLGLRQIRDDLEQTYAPAFCLVDTGYRTKEAVYPVLQESPRWFYGVKGQGSSQMKEDGKRFASQKEVKGNVRWIAKEAYGSWQPVERLIVAMVNADFWKTEVHKMLSSPLENRKVLQLFAGSRRDHLQFAKHITAERRYEEFEKDKGIVTKWTKQKRDNHLFDCTYYAVAAASVYRRVFRRSHSRTKWKELREKRNR